ncbi:MAG: hypothetical protein ISS16_01655 [Ignavibacteria bacterium]|nr:hypothetical protein [Bacteroidota bacterium]MBL7127669.1 hypothetical protein [Ignavibacteria bacterium]
MGVILKGKSGKQYIFEGPYKMKSHLYNEPGVLAFICENGKGTNLKYLSKADRVYESLFKEEEIEIKLRQSYNDFNYAVFYTTNENVLSREQIIKDIKEHYDLMME